MNAKIKVRVKQKRCTQCHEVRPASMFSPQMHALDGLHTWCNPCKARAGSKNRLAARSKWAAIAAENAASA